MKRPSTNDQRFGEFVDRTLEPFLKVSPEQVNSACDRVLQRLQKSPQATTENLAADFDPVRPAGRWLRPAFALSAFAVAVILVVFLQMPRSGASAVVESSGRVLAPGETVRASAAAGDVLKLADGSRVEMRSGSEVTLEQVSDGLRIRLAKGGVIVNAARQLAGRHLYVRTKDVTVSVVGTVFLVNAEEQGSRVAVIEGEVRVQQGATTKNLLPGEQLSTNPKLAALPVKAEIAWSREAEAHTALLRQSVPTPVPPRESFDVASIRINKSSNAPGGRGAPAAGACEGRISQLDPTRISMTGVTVYYLVSLAYGPGTAPGNDPNLGCFMAVETKRLSGGPDWARSERFDVEANIPEGPLPFVTREMNPFRTPATGAPRYATKNEPSPRLLGMLQMLLEDRFKLQLRRDAKEVSGYVLSIAADGPKLVPWKDGEPIFDSSSCGTYEGVKNSVVPPKPYGGLYVCAISARRSPTRWLAGQIEYRTHIPVVDKTGLTGEYTYDFFSRLQGMRRFPPIERR